MTRAPDVRVAAEPRTTGRTSQASAQPPPKRESGSVPPALSLTGVTFTYPNGVCAIKSVNLEIAQGTILGIVGPSGCGKSTLLHLMAGLLRATGGQIVRNVRVAPGRHPLTMVFQRDTLLPWLTAQKNVRFFARFGDYGSFSRRVVHRRKSAVAKRELDERVQHLLRLVGLEQFAGAYPYEMSGGMNRRIAFLAAVAPMPHVLLLDEPFSSVDEPTRIAIHQDAHRVLREVGITTVLVTHDLGEAISLCDEVVLLTKGPSSVASKHIIDFGVERDMLNLRERPEYLHLYGMLWHELGEEIRRTGPDVR